MKQLESFENFQKHFALKMAPEAVVQEDAASSCWATLDRELAPGWYYILHSNGKDTLPDIDRIYLQPDGERMKCWDVFHFYQGDIIFSLCPVHEEDIPLTNPWRLTLESLLLIANKIFKASIWVG